MVRNMTKMHRVILYVTAHGKHEEDPDEIRAEIGNSKWPEHKHIAEITTVDIGKWTDDHPLNQRSATPELYQSYMDRKPKIPKKVRAKCKNCDRPSDRDAQMGLCIPCEVQWQKGYAEGMEHGRSNVRNDVRKALGL